MINKLIAEALTKNLLKEEEGKNPTKECDQLIGEIRGKLSQLSEKLAGLGIDKDSKPYRQINRMYEILASYDPVETNMVEYFRTKTETAANGMLGEEDIKVDKDADADTVKKAAELARQNNMDVQMVDEE